MTKAAESLLIYLISQSCVGINSFSEQLQLCFPLQHKDNKTHYDHKPYFFLLLNHPKGAKVILRSHRYRRIIKAEDELERLICGRADKFCPSSSKHPLRDNITGSADLIVNSKKKERSKSKFQPLVLLFTTNVHSRGSVFEKYKNLLNPSNVKTKNFSLEDNHPLSFGNIVPMMLWRM